MSATDSTDEPNEANEAASAERGPENRGAARTRKGRRFRGGYRPTGPTADRLPPPPASVTGPGATPTPPGAGLPESPEAPESPATAVTDPAAPSGESHSDGG